MKTTPLLIATLLLATTHPAPLRADEVFFDTVSTEKASRMSGAYLGVFGGGVAESDADSSGAFGGADYSNGSGWFAGAEVGYYFRTPFPVRPAIELEAMYLGSELDPGSDRFPRSDFWAAAAFVNVILALDLSTYVEDVGPFVAALRPYIGAGIGAAYTKMDGGTARFADGSSLRLESDSKVTFAYQLFAGLEVALADDVSVYGEYKHLVLDETGNDSVSQITNQLWTLGIKVGY